MNSFSTVNVIIPACGNGSRFGMEIPKHLIDIAGKPMVSWVIEHLPQFCKIRLIVRPEYLAITEAAMARYRNVMVLSAVHYHKGACETVLSAAIVNKQRVLVINCDNIIQPDGGWFLFLSRYDNAIVTFYEENRTLQPPPFSYAKVRNGAVVEVAEKKRISRFACAGAFLFKDFEHLSWLCKAHLNNDPPDARLEHYLAPVYNRLIEDPLSIVHHVPLGKDSMFIRMGTPIEAADARKELNRVYGNQR